MIIIRLVNPKIEVANKKAVRERNIVKQTRKPTEK